LCANLTFKQQAKYQLNQFSLSSMENYVCGAGAKKTVSINLVIFIQFTESATW